MSVHSETSVETLYLEHHSWLVNWLRRRMALNDAAVDVAQDTFLRLLQKSQLPDLQEPRAYLTKIANGLMINLWRRQALETAYLEIVAALPEPLTPSEEQQYITLEALITIDRLLDGLPRKVREAFLLSQLDGVTYAGIAEKMNVDIRTVKRWMLKAFTACLIALE